MDSAAFLAQLRGRGVRLTDEQWEVVAHPLAPLAIFAGPGSGKTTVITLRAAYLYLVEGIAPERQVIFTFTRKSAAELRQRLQTWGVELVGVQAGTFHSLFLRWFAMYYKAQPQLLTEGESRTLLRRAIGEKARTRGEDRFEEAQQMITRAKNTAADAGAYLSHNGHDVYSYYTRYEALKAEVGKWDFDDVLRQFLKRLNDRGFLEFLRAEFHAVMVDEFQDTSHIQWLALNKLCGNALPLTVVGDDDQSIYGFRGAQSSVLQEFLAAYPRAHPVVLGKNFRSVDPVIAVSARLIGHNKERRNKRFEGMVGAGELPRLTVYPDEWTEASVVAAKVGEAVQAGRSVGVLARTNHQLFAVVEALWRQQTAFAAQDASVLPYRQFDVANLLRWLKAAANLLPTRETQAAFSHFLLAKGVNQEAYEPLLRQRVGNGRDWLKTAAATDRSGMAHAFFELLERVGQLSASAAYHEVWRVYRPYCDARRRKRNDDLGASAVETVAKGIAQDLSLLVWLRVVEERLRMGFGTKSPVQVLTMHGAKGLEFDEVFLVGLHDQALPHRKSRQEKDRVRALEEERRLFYVGCTRAKWRLWLSYARRGSGRECQASPFLAELGLKKRTQVTKKKRNAVIRVREH